MLWGYPLQFWQTVVFWLWFVAAATGALAVAASFGSSVISYYITDATEAAAKLEIGKANAVAGQANENAGNANERAGHANEAAAEANRRAAQLEKEAAEARSEQERLKVKALELEVQLSKIGPRRLTAEQISAIVDASRQENFRSIITFNFAGDPESVQFAENIAHAFNVAGWSAKAGNKLFGNPPRGIAAYDTTGALQRVLSRANIRYEDGADGGQGAYITVGEKPLE